VRLPVPRLRMLQRFQERLGVPGVGDFQQLAEERATVAVIQDLVLNPPSKHDPAKARVQDRWRRRNSPIGFMGERCRRWSSTPVRSTRLKLRRTQPGLVIRMSTQIVSQNPKIRSGIERRQLTRYDAPEDDVSLEQPTAPPQRLDDDGGGGTEQEGIFDLTIVMCTCGVEETARTRSRIRRATSPRARTIDSDTPHETARRARRSTDGRVSISGVGNQMNVEFQKVPRLAPDTVRPPILKLLGGGK
jgi:hypothetical protein